MSKLNAASRRKIPSSKFGLPGRRAYPIEDRSHAAKGKLSASSAAKIRAKANRILGE